MNFGNNYGGAANRPPPEEAPPSYAASRYVPARFVRNNLRPAVLMLSFFSAIWALAIGTNYIKDRRDHNLTSKLTTIYLALALIYYIVAAIEIFGFGAAWTQRVGLVRIYFLGSVVGALAVSASEVMRLVVHFVDKTDIIAACVGDQLDANTPGDTITSDQANTLCTSSWNGSLWWDIVLMILSFILSFFFASLAASYLHQLQNPASMRTQTAHLAPSSAYNYPLAPYPNVNPYPGGPAPPQYQPGGLPHYDGYAEGFGPGKEKEEANPFADATTPNTTGFRTEMNREEQESSEQVTFQPRRETEGRV